jgi:hypothetical protein
MREVRAKTGWEDGPIYTASQDPQVDRREAHFGKRARVAKIGPSEEIRERRRVVRKDAKIVSKSAVEARTFGKPMWPRVGAPLGKCQEESRNLGIAVILSPSSPLLNRELPRDCSQLSARSPLKDRFV